MAEKTQDPAGSYGERLQSARRAQMISVEDVAQELRLSTDAVNALEAGQIEMFGAHAHVVGHLCCYCKLLKISAEELITDYRRKYPDWDRLPAKVGLVPSRVQRWGRLKLITWILVATALCLIAYQFWGDMVLGWFSD